MTKLTAMRGYSGSGKSTRAMEIAKATGAVVVSRDHLRRMLLGEWWTGKKEDEDRVTLAEASQVEAFLRNGIDTIVDATHLNPVYLRRWARLATKLGVDFGVVDVIEDLAECRKRDHQRMLDGGRYVGDKVIEQQAKRFPAEKWPKVAAQPFVIEPVERDEDLPDAIIVDIDGTLAHIPEGGRSPFDYSRVGEDEIDDDVAHLVSILFDERYVLYSGPAIIIMSGRDDSCRDDTAKWLANHGIAYDKLIMRPAGAKDERGNKLPDYQVKYQLFNEHVRGKFNVNFVLDDRDQVVEMWRKLGLKCFQVAPGDF